MPSTLSSLQTNNGRGNSTNDSNRIRVIMGPPSDMVDAINRADTKERERVGEEHDEKKHDNKKRHIKLTARLPVSNSVSTPDEMRMLESGKFFDPARPYVVLVHTSWCHFCKDLRPEWDVFAEKMMESGLQVVEIDMSMLPVGRDINSSVVNSIENGGKSPISSVPHIVLVLGPKGPALNYDEYALKNTEPDEARTALDMTKFVHSALMKKGGRQEKSPLLNR